MMGSAIGYRRSLGEEVEPPRRQGGQGRAKSGRLRNHECGRATSPKERRNLSADAKEVPKRSLERLPFDGASRRGIVDRGSWIVDRGSWIVDGGWWMVDDGLGDRISSLLGGRG
jgi:hypothetical protein